MGQMRVHGILMHRVREFFFSGHSPSYTDRISTQVAPFSIVVIREVSASLLHPKYLPNLEQGLALYQRVLLAVCSKLAGIPTGVMWRKGTREGLFSVTRNL